MAPIPETSSLYHLGPFGHHNLISAIVLGAGGLWLASVLYTVIRSLLSIFILPGKSLASFGPKGSWVVITGASDGIGKEYARQIAAKGYNLVLASRTKSKLESVAAEIKQNTPGTQIETLAIDFSSASDADYDKLDKILDGKRIAVLVNNVGQSHSIPVSFAETTRKEREDIININVLATLRVTRIILPHMQQYKSGLILTMGSLGGLTPTPLLATYSGSKAFLQQWSNALAAELSETGISVHFVQAYLITSAMSKIRRVSLAVPSEKQFVRAVLNKIGRRGGSVGYAYTGSPYWSHAIATFGITYVLGPMSKFLLGVNKGMHADIRKRALRKAEREKEKSKKGL